MTKTTIQAGVAALAAAAMLLSGCGTSEGSGDSRTAATAQAQTGNGVAALTADEILAKAREALKKAGSYHVKGSATQDGTEMAMDFRVSGAGFSGKISMGAGADVDLLVVDGKQFMRPSEGFWTMLGMGETAKTVSAALGTKWLEVPAADKSMSSIFGIINIDEMLSVTGTLTKGEPTQLDGKPVVTLTDSGDADSQLFIAATGDPYPVRMGTATGDGLSFTEFGGAFDDIKLPAAGQVLDMAALTGKK